MATMAWAGRALAILAILAGACTGGEGPAPTPTVQRTEPPGPSAAAASPTGSPAAPRSAASPAASPAAPQVSLAPAGGPAVSPVAPQVSPAPAGRPASATKPAAGAPTGQARPVKIGWTPSFVFLPLRVAVDTGELRQEGLDASLVDLPGEAEVSAALLGRSIDLAAAPAERPLILFERNQPSKNLVQIQAEPGFVVVTRKDLSIKPGDYPGLTNKRLGVTRAGSEADLIMRALLRSANIDPDRDLRIVAAGGSAQTQAGLAARQIDVAITTEPGVTQMLEANLVDTFLDLRKEGPATIRDTAFTTLQATDEYIAQNPEVIRGAMRAIARTQKRLRENPASALPAMKQVFPNVDDATLSRISTAEAPTYHAAISPEEIRNLSQIQKEGGNLKTDVPFDQVTIGPEFRQLWQLSE